MIFNCHAFAKSWIEDTYRWLEDAGNRGKDIFGVCSTKSIAVLVAMESNVNPFQAVPSYFKVRNSGMSHDEQVAELLRPEVREAVLAEVEERGGFRANPASLFPMLDTDGAENWASFEPQPENSVLSYAQALGKDPIAHLYDLMLEQGGKTIMYQPGQNYESGNLDDVREMMLHPRTVIGLADSGAHVGGQQDSANCTYLLSYWVRDRERLTGKPGLPLELAVKNCEQMCRLRALTTPRRALAKGLAR